MWKADTDFDTILKEVRQEYEKTYDEVIKLELDYAERLIPKYLQFGKKFPGYLPLRKNCFKSSGSSEVVFYLVAYVDAHNKDILNLKYDVLITAVAKFKCGDYTNYIAYTGDPDALFWEHFFRRYREREERAWEKPEMLYLRLLSDMSMWRTDLFSYCSERYHQAYVRPWGDGIALGTILKEGELRGTYISRKMMREDQNALWKALLFMGEIQSIYGYKLEDNLERTMVIYDSNIKDAEQITQYFIYYWQLRRIKAYYEGKLNSQIERQVEVDANRFFEENGLIIDYRKECIIDLKKSPLFDARNW